MSSFRYNKSYLQDTKNKLHRIKTKDTKSSTTTNNTKETIKITTTFYTVLNINVSEGDGNMAMDVYVCFGDRSFMTS